MPGFRFHRLDRDGRRQGAPVEAQCSDEEQAFEQARALIQRRREMVEIWGEGHFIAIATHEGVDQIM